MQDMIEDLSEQKNILEARVDETRREIEVKSEQLDNARNALQNTGRDLVNARARNDETEKRLQETEENLGRIDDENARLQEQVNQVNRDNLNYHLAMEELRQQQEVLRQQLDDANLERETANLRLVEMEAHIQHQTTAIQGHEQRAAAMQNTINTRNQALRSRDALVLSLQTEIVATKANLEQLRNTMQENSNAED